MKDTDGNYFTTSGYNNCSNEMLDAKIKKKILDNESWISENHLLR